MKNIVVTGAEGFVGLHARFLLHELERAGEARAVPLSHDEFQDDAKLASALKGADAVFHLAGINRGSDEELEAGNIALAERLVKACVSANATPHIVFSSSVHEKSDTPYGRGKRGAASAFASFAKQASARVTTFIFPHIFGEFARPNYNSAVATFAHDLARGNESAVNKDGTVELVYVRDAVRMLYEAVKNGTEGVTRVEGARKTIPELYALMSGFAAEYRTNAYPAAATPLERALFNTLQSAFFEVNPVRTLEPKSDERGTLYETIRSGRVDQVFFSTTVPGKTRGNHYHTHKMERFCVISGEGEIQLRRLLTGTVHTFKVSGRTPVYIDMPTYYAHNIRNTGTEPLVTLFWVSEQLDPRDPDTVPEVV